MPPKKKKKSKEKDENCPEEISEEERLEEVGIFDDEYDVDDEDEFDESWRDT